LKDETDAPASYLLKRIDIDLDQVLAFEECGAL